MAGQDNLSILVVSTWERLTTKGGSRLKVQFYDERLLFFIRICFVLHQNALAAQAACLDPRLATAKT